MPFFLALVLLVLGCSGEITGQHCYVVSGLYLIDGIYRSPTGYVEDIFYDYNTNPKLRLMYLTDISIDDVWRYQSDGCRVAVLYNIGDGMNHTRPLAHHEQLGFDPVGYHISCEVQ